MNCTECKERLYPDNPTMPMLNRKTFRYLPPICKGCSNASPVDSSPAKQYTLELSKLQQQIYQLQGQIAYFSNKFVRKSDIKFVRKSNTETPGYQGLRERRKE